MTQLGLGVMIRTLFGQREPMDMSLALGQEITGIAIAQNALGLSFKNGKQLMIKDEGQSCCESRYMTTDDDLQYYVGATLLDMELASVVDKTGADEMYCDEHQAQFLHVKTSKGSFTVENHVEHNGYYGGFSIEASITDV